MRGTHRRTAYKKQNTNRQHVRTNANGRSLTDTEEYLDKSTESNTGVSLPDSISVTANSPPSEKERSFITSGRVRPIERGSDVHSTGFTDKHAAGSSHNYRYESRALASPTVQPRAIPSQLSCPAPDGLFPHPTVKGLLYYETLLVRQR